MKTAIDALDGQARRSIRALGDYNHPDHAESAAILDVKRIAVLKVANKVFAAQGVDRISSLDEGVARTRADRRSAYALGTVCDQFRLSRTGAEALVISPLRRCLSHSTSGVPDLLGLSSRGVSDSSASTRSSFAICASLRSQSLRTAHTPPVTTAPTPSVTRLPTIPPSFAPSLEALVIAVPPCWVTHAPDPRRGPEP